VVLCPVVACNTLSAVLVLRTSLCASRVRDGRSTDDAEDAESDGSDGAFTDTVSRSSGQSEERAGVAVDAVVSTPVAAAIALRSALRRTSASTRDSPTAPTSSPR
jgi:hypothetical protein